MRKLPLWLAGLALAAGLTACSGDGDNDDESAEERYTLQLLHVADMDGAPEALDNVENFSALLAQFRSQMPENTLFVSSGDNYIPGPRYFAAADGAVTDVLGVPGNGRGDIALLNGMGLDAAAVGNHDLDEGTTAFAGIVTAEGGYPGARFPYLSANLDFSGDEALAPLVQADGKPAENGVNALAGSAVVDLGGETIGIVGASTPQLASITNTGDIGVQPDSGAVQDLAAVIQQSVDELTAKGIDKVVLLAHMQQISVEKALAPLLEDVDIIVAGGSNTLLADGNDVLRAGDTAVDSYPLVFSSATREPVLVVNVDGDYRYLGRLVVDFDADGVIDTDSLESADNGAWASTDAVVADVGGAPIARVSEIAEALREVLVARDGNIMGRTGVYLDGRRSEMRTEETNLGNLTADANLWYANQAEAGVNISLKNGGGIRADIGEVVVPPGSNDPDDTRFLPPQANPSAGKSEGDISQFDIEGSLRFNNSLTLITVTAAELRDILEHAVAATADGATPGQFPQVAGMRFTFDPHGTPRNSSDGDTTRSTSTSGSRVRELVILDSNGTPADPSDDMVADTVVSGGVLQGDPTRRFRMVTLQFLAGCVPSATVTEPSDSCGDGYPFKGLTAPDRTDLNAADDVAPAYDPMQADFAPTGTEQDALAEYLRGFFSPADGGTGFGRAEQAPGDDERIANVAPVGLD
ncbi:bifunctional metallophosphatase/5'-nucleotidase [Arhodomonas sp. AD133]|uniref:bifunctional metallophosphatase/5'-nucleotidase n=1 Tax=Arhodomonas sp. AD133 TaxID=3415009 RepID=UPI003EC0A601